MDKKELEKYFVAFRIIAFVMVLMDIYYRGYPFFSALGVRHELTDGLFLSLRQAGLFREPYLMKLFALAFLAFSVLNKDGKMTDRKWPVIGGGLGIGALLYFAGFFPFRSAIWYIASTAVGFVILAVSLSWASRKFRNFHAADNSNLETFKQCERLIENDHSINIPMRYYFQKRWRKGWLNILSPERGTMVMGIPGSGKSYAVYGPMIEQSLARGWAMFCYDFKFGDLTWPVYNEMLLNLDKYKVKPEFHIINFDDPRYSHRCNPINPKYIKDPSDSSEIAEIIMANVDKTSMEKKDFFTQSARLFVDAFIWFLSRYEGGRYCTIPHLILLLGENYADLLEIMNLHKEIPGLKQKIQAFLDAMKTGAEDQLQGQIASARIPLNKLVSPQLFWVMSEDEVNLDINDPEHPQIVCVGNNPDRKEVYGTAIALLFNRASRLINHKHKLRCMVLLDELPTMVVKDLDFLLATARSNGVMIVMGAQDRTQLIRDYTQQYADVIFGMFGNLICGTVKDKTAESYARMMGRQFRERQSQTSGTDSESVNTSYQLEEILPQSRIETLSQGTFFGVLADTFTEKNDEKLFCAEIIRDAKAIKERQSHYVPIPVMTDFGEEKIRQSAMEPEESKRILRTYVQDNKLISEEKYKEKMKNIDMYNTDQYDLAMDELLESAIKVLGDKKRAEIIENEIQERINKVVDETVTNKFKEIEQDVVDLVAIEMDKVNEVKRMIEAGCGADEIESWLAIHQ